jgi:hypothetical protein
MQLANHRPYFKLTMHTDVKAHMMYMVTGHSATSKQAMTLLVVL